MNAFNRPLAVLPPSDASSASDEDWDAPTLLTLPNQRKLTTSIRATAQVFQDPRSAVLLERVRMVAPSDANVLIIGETGTGKELIARQVHDLSRRSSRPFVAVNCGAFSESLVESELFGHEKGAFTGAFSARPAGSRRPTAARCSSTRSATCRCRSRSSCCACCKSAPIDVRVVAATNVRLQDAVTAGHFREDLFYRLHVVHLALPTLRERPGDILPLARHFIEEYRQRLGYGAVRLDAGLTAC
jgi:transcriptional regulator with GAF, ATPase, and Fis domain